MMMDIRDADLIDVERKLLDMISRANGKISTLEFQVGTLFNTIALECLHRTANMAMPMNAPPSYVCFHDKNAGNRCTIDKCPKGMING